MKGLFSFDGPIYKFCVLIYETCMLNLLWFVCSIPIVTIGASTTALCSVYGKKVRGESYKIYSGFFKAYKESFKQSSILGIIITLIISLSYYNIIKLNSFGKAYAWLYGIQFFIIFQVLFISSYIFPLIARFNMSIYDIVMNSVILAYKHIFISIINVLILLGLITLTFFKPAFILFISSSYIFISSYFIEKIFKKNMKKTYEAFEHDLKL